MAINDESLVAKGYQALQAGDWSGARDAFESALRQRDDPRARCGLADALWWLGDLQGILGHLEQAYSAFRREGAASEAATTALYLALYQVVFLANRPAAAGWTARAARLIEENEQASLRGALALVASMLEGDPVVAEQRARDAVEQGREAGDVDLELRALSQLGSVQILQGRVGEGIALLDEAMAGALADDGGDPRTVVFASCNMLSSCAGCGDFHRAAEWVRASDRFVQRFGCPFLYIGCRTLYGAVLLATGEWDRAEEELELALAHSRDFAPAYYSQALASLAELRMVQGRIDEAGRLLEAYRGDPATAVAVARLELLLGRPADAALVASRWLDALKGGRLERSRLLEVLAEAELACGDVASAARRGRMLREEGQTLGCEILTARGYRLEGCATGDPARVRERLDTAMEMFRRLNMPYEAARTRLCMALRLQETAPDMAVFEARAAHTSLEALGAARDADLASHLLRTLGDGGTRPGRRQSGEITARERQVLDLLGEGLSNPEIAERLFLSRKTVEHHVARILAKLGLKNRAEAAVVAVRWSTSGSPQK
jgi:DNA-binding CsgD family transcriptional regulator